MSNQIHEQASMLLVSLLQIGNTYKVAICNNINHFFLAGHGMTKCLLYKRPIERPNILRLNLQESMIIIVTGKTHLVKYYCTACW